FWARTHTTQVFNLTHRFTYVKRPLKETLMNPISRLAFLPLLALPILAHASVSIEEMSAHNPLRHRVEAIWQPEIDAVISSGILSVSAVEIPTGLNGRKNNISELATANEERLARIVSSSTSDRAITKKGTKVVISYSWVIDQALRDAINSV